MSKHLNLIHKQIQKLKMIKHIRPMLEGVKTFKEIKLEKLKRKPIPQTQNHEAVRITTLWDTV